MNDRDALNDLDSCETGTKMRCGAVLIDPSEHVLDRSGIFDGLTVNGDGGGRMKRRPHEICVACTSGRDIAVYSTGDRVMFNEVGIGGRLDRREILGFLDRDLAWEFGAQAAPGINLVPERE